MKKFFNKNSEEYNSFIYIWTDNFLKKYYIGSHIGNIEDGYLFGGIDIKKEYKKRPNDFERKILSYHIVNSNEEIRLIEKDYLVKYDVENNSNFYNRTNESYGGCHKKSVEERLSDIDENGLNAFQRAAKKMVQTRKLKNSYKTAKLKEFETKKEKMNLINSKISETLKGSIWIFKENETKYIKQNEIDIFLQNGWKLGRKNYSYDFCHEFAIKNKITSAKSWKNIAKLNNLPYNPNIIFKNNWQSWEIFLGKTKHQIKLSYNDCLIRAQELNISSAKEYFKKAKENYLPSHPERTYKNEWINWEIFLGK
jgi:hypothetical protein